MTEKKLYRLVYGYLLVRIQFNFYPKGEYLPSIHELSGLLGVSTMTVRGALKLLEQDGYISCKKNQRTVVSSSRTPSIKELPANLLVSDEVLWDLHQSLSFILPATFFCGLSAYSQDDLHRQRQLLERPPLAWDEPPLHFMSFMVKGSHNSLLADLYYDTILFSYPAFLVSLSKSPQTWRNTYQTLQNSLREMITLKENGQSAALQELIYQTFHEFDPYPYPAPFKASNHELYRWRKPNICFSIANELIYRVFHRVYLPGSYLPSPKTLSEEFSTPVITVRRAISLLNGLGVTESINGKGTLVLTNEQGVKKIKWADPAVKKNILSYLEALHFLAITCRQVAVHAFHNFSRERREKVKEKIICIKDREYAGLIISLCMYAILTSIGPTALREIYSQLTGLLLWGHPLFYYKIQFKSRQLYGFAGR